MVTHLKIKELNDVFPNLMIILRMFLTTIVANCKVIFNLKTGKKLYTIHYAREKIKCFSIIND